MNLTTEQVQMLAEAERQMDAGDAPFVVWGGRMMVDHSTMDELGLQSGQTVSNVIAGEILKRNLARIVALGAIHKASSQ